MRIRSLTQDVIYTDAVPVGLGNYAISDLSSLIGAVLTGSVLAGYLKLDVFAALTSRVKTWRVTLSGSVSVAAPNAFNSTTTFGGSQDIQIIQPGDETDFAYGKEIYAIRINGSQDSTFTAITSLTMVGQGAVEQPFAPGTLVNFPVVGGTNGPNLTPLRTQGLSGQATFVFSVNTDSRADSTSGPVITYVMLWRLQATPISVNTAPTTPILVGNVSIQIPNWISDGTNTQTVELYLDGVGDAILDAQGSGIEYGTFDTDVTSASANITMVPLDSWRYIDSGGVAAWDASGNLLVPFNQLKTGEP